MIVDVPGVRVGHWTDAEALTGCTVILPPPGTTGSVAIPGNAPATRETDVIAPQRDRVGSVSAVLLTGGSAFGLAAADGVMRYCEEHGIGHPTLVGVVPIVPAAAIMDLGLGSSRVRPGPAEGYAACEAASTDERREGNIGAGTGATVGKTGGPDNLSKGGLGSAGVRDGALVVGALAVVNAVGDIIDADGSVIAGARGEGAWPEPGPPPRPATTIACVATNATLSKAACAAVAARACDGLAMAVAPVHTMWDGDAVFALATNTVGATEAAVGRMAAEALADAIRRAVRAATGVDGAPALGHRRREGTT